MSLDLWRAPEDEVGDLTTTFMADTTEYTVMALNSDESVTVKAIPTDMEATVEVNGTEVDADGTAAVDLDVGMNTITVMVTAQDGTTMMTYMITVTRAEPETTEVTRTEVLSAIQAYLNEDADALSRADLLALISGYLAQ